MRDNLSQVFGGKKLHNKGSRNIYFFYWKKLSRFWGQFSSTALVIVTFYVKYYSVLTKYYIIDLKIAINFLGKKIIFLSFFYAILCDKKLGINCFLFKKGKNQ